MDAIHAQTLRHELIPPGIALLTLNRPAARNALNRALLDSLMRVLRTLQQDTDLRALIVTGASERAFCAGADLIERQGMNALELASHTHSIAAVADALAEFPVPTIAAVNGYALAGGAEIALACDLRVASTSAIFGFPEVQIGIFPGAGGVVRLPRLVGAGAARDLLFTGRQIDAREAANLGLIDRLVAESNALTEARSIAAAIAQNAPLAIRAVKRALLDSADRPITEAAEIVTRHRRLLDDTDDYVEGLTAFKEKRRPQFRGR